ncbi:MAG: ATP-binding protein [Isosphaeraceae bacterium]
MHNQLRRSAQRKIVFILAAIVVILAIVAALAFETTSRMIHDRGWVAHTHRVLAELQETRAIVDDAVEEERKYLTSGDDRFGAQFEDHVGQFERKLDVLGRLLADNSAQRERLSRLAAAAQSCFASMRAAIETCKLVGTHQAREQVAAELRAGPVGPLRKILLAMVADELALLQARIDNSRSSDLQTAGLLGLFLVLFAGSLTAFFVTVKRSLSRQAEVSSELHKSREQFELAVRGSKDGLWDWDIETDDEYFSPRWKSQLGYEDHEIAHRFSEFDTRLHPDDRDRVHETLALYLAGRLPSYSVEFRMRTKEGGYRWILARGVALRDAQGEAFRMAGSHTDITERKEFESRLAEQNQLLERAMRAERKTNETLKRAQALMVQNEKMIGLGQMVAGVAHEINNPLAFITNNVTMLQRDFDDLHHLVRLYESNGHNGASVLPTGEESIASFCARVDIDETLNTLPGLLARTAEGLKRIGQIVGDLRLFARLDEGEINEADLNAGIRSTVTVIQGHARTKDVNLSVELGSVPRVTCRAARINQVVMNLLSNAIDACSPGGQVTVRTGTENGEVRIEVIDDGHGIAASVRDRIFDPFFTTKPIGKGTGLGLSISYGIIHDHGGTIEVDSKPGRGSHFTVRLPLQPLRVAADAEAAEAVAGA